MNRITHASLFSGIGACDLAAEWMGWENKFWCEIDTFCQEVLKYHFPKSIGYGNVKETDFTQWRGRIDVLTGGFPCQPFSVAGKRKGANDDRYLWPEMLRAIREIQPDWVIGENVGGIVTMVQPGETVEVGREKAENGEDNVLYEQRQQFVVETVCQDLEREGYSVQPILIPACAVGAPHRRDRVFFIAKRAAENSVGIRFLEHYTEEESETRGFGKFSTGDNWGVRASASATVRSCERCLNGSDNRERRQICSDRKWDFTENQQERSGRKRRIGENGATISDTNNKLLQGRNSDKQKGRNPAFGAETRCSESRWAMFPTQSPVCRGNDGLPFDVDDLAISFAKWRTESVKAYGNAIVPQVIYEIFKAIELL